MILALRRLARHAFIATAVLPATFLWLVDAEEQSWMATYHGLMKAAGLVK